MKLEELEQMFPKKYELKAPTEFKSENQMGDNLLESWDIFEYHFNEYYRRHNGTGDHFMKPCHLRELIGDNIKRGLISKEIYIENYKTSDAILSIIREYIFGGAQILQLKDDFFTTFQEKHENVNEYCKRLLRKAKFCQFDENEHLLKEQLIFGIQDDSIRQETIRDFGEELLTSNVNQVRKAIREKENFHKPMVKQAGQKNWGRELDFQVSGAREEAEY